MKTSKIIGKERRALKKELAQLKRLVNIFWYAHNFHKAMCEIYGGYEVMSDEIAWDRYNDALALVKKIEEELKLKH